MHTLLVVDDQRGMRLLLREVFHQEGLCVITAASGTEALTILQLTLPDLMLLDLKLPKLDGRTVLQKAIRLCPELRVIVMTADYNEDCALQLLSYAGVVAVIAKPFDVHRLRELVTRHLFSGHGTIAGPD